jgi:hypothetical protein
LSHASYSVNHVNYVDQINSTSNKANSAGFDSTLLDDISSYVGISGLGLTLGLKIVCNSFIIFVKDVCESILLKKIRLRIRILALMVGILFFFKRKRYSEQQEINRKALIYKANRY